MTKIPTRTLPLRTIGSFRGIISCAATVSTNSSRLPATKKSSSVLKNASSTVSATSFQGVRLYSSALPSHKRVALPALSPTMELGTVVSWQKQVGDELAEGDLLCEIETDKATMGFETPEEGFLAKILIEEGTKDVPIGRLLCIIVENKDDVAAFADFKDDNRSTAPIDKKAKAKEEPKREKQVPLSQSKNEVTSASATSPPQQYFASSRVSATPFARKLAAERGLDLGEVPGSGPNGRILAVDLQGAPKKTETAGRAAGAGHSALEYTDVPLTNMRRTISKRLTESKSTIPHYYLTSEINLENLIQIRSKLNDLLKNSSGSGKLSINDFVVKASALACQRVPECNSFFMDTFIRKNHAVDVSVAVSTPAGLITPIIFNAHAKGLAAISSEIRELVLRARDGKLQPHEFQGGTFTVSNLGMFGSVSDFTAIINPPQSCILAVGGAQEKLIPDEKDGYRTAKVMKITLSCDHRTVDGAVGAVWLRHFKEFLEKPHTMLL